MAEFKPHGWHEASWKGLQAQFASQRLPHALLLTGPAGTGKSVFAGALAGLVLCAAPRDGAACGVCKSCLLWKAETHPDFHRLAPLTDEKSGKTSRVIKIDQVRALLDVLAKSAQLGGWRVAVIEPADTLNTNAANSLLKTLEEPGARTLIILLTDQPLGLLPTIRSRCRHLALGVPERREALSWLEPQLEHPGDAGLLLGLANGAPLAALSMSRQEVFRQREDLAKRLYGAATGRIGPLAAATACAKLPAEETWQWLYGLLADVGLMTHDLRTAIKNADLLPIIGQLADTLGNRRALELQALCLENQRLLAANIQPGLLWDRFWEQIRG